MEAFERIQELLGNNADYYLSHHSKKIVKDNLTIPGPSIIDNFRNSDRSIPVLKSLSQLYNNGRLKGTGYLNILPIDQGIEHSAAFSFYKNQDYFNPENVIKLALEGGCNAVASTKGLLAMHSRKYADKVPFIVKINHNELLTYPNTYDQIKFSSVVEAWNMGATGIGATIYFGSEQSDRQIQEIAMAFEKAHELGMATILWCYIRNKQFKRDDADYHTAADLTGQANHIGVTIKADIIKQKLPTLNYGFRDLNSGKFDDEMYDALGTEHPIDLCRWQVSNCYMGQIGLINSGGASKGGSDLKEAATAAIINKRAGGSGLIMGRKAFQKPLKEGVEILNLVQDIYLDSKITIA
ncbi:fructose-bisphosphate aldolase [Salegentibacter salinarum]|uniref:fructose-bisphosphate aldolase n=1 Tax=Salegentibacter salinarum TaxID=447422 RepID=A0A2N0TNB5_9FLAO|nr:class I fructose-bisphosphate aldolase [Salegentibacter salinarum]PKD16222.1 fructose-bisphosphate aldolase [Salegentibacter salinarum]SKB67763.1 fructose-bisphosphate aldolase, class I [Salegentibacter salinarum]